MNSVHHSILIIQPSYKNFGGYFRSFAMAKSLAKLHQRVTLLISCKEKSYRSVYSHPLPGLTQIELPRHIFSLNGRYVRALLACWHLLINHYDVVVCCGITQPESSIPLIFARILGKKVILDRDEFWQSNVVQYSWIIRLYVWFCEEILIRLFKTHIVTSELLLEHSRKKGARSVIKIINGVDREQFEVVDQRFARQQLGLDPDGKILLSFGNTYDNNRAQLLFETFEKILSLDDSVVLLFNLNPKFYIEKTTISNKKSVLEKTIETGFIQPDQLGVYLGACDVILFLTGNTENEQACFPIRIGSYINGEKPIATLETGTEWCKTISKYGCLISGQNTNELAQNIINYLNNKQAYSSFKEKIESARRKLSWETLSLSIVEFIARKFS